MSRVYSLRPNTALPSQKVVLTGTKKKVQLIDLICEDLVNHSDEFQHHKLVVTGRIPTPVEIHKGFSTVRNDMENTQEEVDTIILHQLSVVNPHSAIVIADDTDIFVLLVHFYFHGKIPEVYMVSPVHGRAAVDIMAVVEKHSSVVPDLLCAHGLTGCDTVGTYHGLGKGVALKVIRTGKYPLMFLGEVDKSLTDISPECTAFILACYNQSACCSLTEARHKIWSSKVSRSTASAPKLKTLPPTNEAFLENVVRAHIQVAIWKNALRATPPALDPTNWGWTKENGPGSLEPNTVPKSVQLGPECLLKLIKCTCRADTPCSTRRCGCRNTGMVCSVFCSCRGDECWNSASLEQDEEYESD